MVWNAEKILSDEQFPGIILKSLFGYRDKIYIVQAVGYLIFLISIGGLYFRSITGGDNQNSKNKVMTTTPGRN
jgi:high-affinity iron transporter